MTQVKQKQGGTELQDIFFYPPFDLSAILCIIFSLLFLYFLYAYYGWFSHHQ